MRITGADLDKETYDSMVSLHKDTWQEVMIRLFKSIEESYVHTKKTSFYTYVVNVLPKMYSMRFLLLHNIEKKYCTTNIDLPSYDDYETKVPIDLMMRFKAIKLDAKSKIQQAV